jgi:hypothetical protein
MSACFIGPNSISEGELGVDFDVTRTRITEANLGDNAIPVRYLGRIGINNSGELAKLYLDLTLPVATLINYDVEPESAKAFIDDKDEVTTFVLKAIGYIDSTLASTSIS